MKRLPPDSRAALAMLAAMALFVGNDALVKMTTHILPVSQVLVVRSIFSCIVMLALVVAMRQAGALTAMFTPRIALRAALEGCIAWGFVTALSNLPIANVSAIFQASTLIIIALAALLGIDRIGWRRWLAVFIGFIGVLMVVKPSPSGFNEYSLLALGTCLVVATRELITRNIAVGVPSGVVALASTMGVMLAGALIGLGEYASGAGRWLTPGGREISLLASAALLVALGNLLLVNAYRYGDVSIVSALRYSVMIYALLLGFFLFGEWPDTLSLIGAGLIVGSGLYALHRQRLKNLAARRDPAHGVHKEGTPGAGADNAG
jgi:drug/metabolite transporter (DMT)-like permease